MVAWQVAIGPEVAAQPVDGGFERGVVERDFAVEAFGAGVGSRVFDVSLLKRGELCRVAAVLAELWAERLDRGERVARPPDEEGGTAPEVSC